MKYYTGLSNDGVPLHFQAFIFLLSRALSETHTVRSGDSNIGEFCFREGSDSQGEIMIPWPEFNESPSKFTASSLPSESKTLLASMTHHDNLKLSDEKTLNIYCNIGQQLFGQDATDKSSFLIVCYSKHLVEDGSHDLVQHAMSIAEENGIPVFNICKKEHFSRIRNMIEKNNAYSIYDQTRHLLLDWVKNGSPRGIPSVTVEAAKEALSKIEFTKQ